MYRLSHKVCCCRRLFAELQAGTRYSADPKAFAQALNLDHTIQQVAADTHGRLYYHTHHWSIPLPTWLVLQDGQEFLKLLLSLLESKLGQSGQPVSVLASTIHDPPGYLEAWHASVFNHDVGGTWHACRLCRAWCLTYTEAAMHTRPSARHASDSCLHAAAFRNSCAPFHRLTAPHSCLARVLSLSALLSPVKDRAIDRRECHACSTQCGSLVPWMACFLEGNGSKLPCN